MTNLASQPGRASEKSLTAIIYALYAATPLLGFTAIAALIMNYIKREDVAGTWLESHFRWQIRTFWFGLLWSLIGLATFWFLIGWVVVAVNGIWFIYRIVKGWLRLSEERPMYSA